MPLRSTSLRNRRTASCAVSRSRNVSLTTFTPVTWIDESTRPARTRFNRESAILASTDRRRPQHLGKSLQILIPDHSQPPGQASPPVQSGVSFGHRGRSVPRYGKLYHSWPVLARRLIDWACGPGGSPADVGLRHGSQSRRHPPTRQAFSPRLVATSMAKSPATPRELIDRLDSRHDELIQRLDELNAQIERALADVYRNRAAAESRREAEVRKAA